MTLTPGTRLGPYEILSALGAGGMGEVYRAKDTRLDRTVAIKVLPSHLANNADLRLRFEREARAVSSLSHPHICALYDVGRQDEIDFLVMEYLEGETLADRLLKGPLSTDQVLRYGIEIADALDRAHRQGVVHRDLKPGNIMLTKSGSKLLDFGLAKFKTLEPKSGTSSSSMLATEHAQVTGEGTILGTFQYMAPEQLEGKEADARTDIFAFGAVLFESATGVKAFSGKSQASLISAIMSSEPPPIATVQPMTPAALDRVVKRCLAKEPDERWQTAHDLAQELKWIAEGGSQAGVPAPVVSRRKNRERIAWIAAAVLLIVVIVLAIPYLLRAPAELRVVSFSIHPPEKVNMGESLALSPDGRFLVFTAQDASGKTLLWVRSLETLAPQALAGTEGARFPFWSPDSRFVGFFSDGKLKKIEVTGGPPQTLADASMDPRGGTWNRDGIILFAPNPTSPIQKVSSAGGAASPITELDTSRKETSHRWPWFLPDGRHFLYFDRGTQKENQGLFVGSLETKERKSLLNAESSVAYAPADANSPGKGVPGYLLFMRERTLMAQGFDSNKLQLLGETFPVAEGVVHYGENGPTGYGAFSISANGTLSYMSGSVTATQLVWIDRAGNRLGTIGQPGFYAQPSLSPDEKRVATDRNDPQGSDLWLIELSRGLMTRFTFDAANDDTSVWSPDGNRIVFGSTRKGSYDLYQKVSSGAGSEEFLLHTGVNIWPDDWSLDGRFIIYESQEPKTKSDLWVLPMLGDRKPFPFLKTEFNEAHAQFSPDGRWIAYVSDESGQMEVYVQSFPVSGGKYQVSTTGGDQPKWRRDGKEIFYLAGDGKLMSVPIAAGANFEAGSPKTLFQVRVSLQSINGDRNSYIVTADGKRFLINSLVNEVNSQPITIVLNWMAALKKN